VNMMVRSDVGMKVNSHKGCLHRGEDGSESKVDISWVRWCVDIWISSRAGSV